MDITAAYELLKQQNARLELQVLGLSSDVPETGFHMVVDQLGDEVTKLTAELKTVNDLLTQRTAERDQARRELNDVFYWLEVGVS